MRQLILCVLLAMAPACDEPGGDGVAVPQDCSLAIQAICTRMAACMPADSSYASEFSEEPVPLSDAEACISRLQGGGFVYRANIGAGQHYRIGDCSSGYLPSATCGQKLTEMGCPVSEDPDEAYRFYRAFDACSMPLTACEEARIDVCDNLIYGCYRPDGVFYENFEDCLRRVPMRCASPNPREGCAEAAKDQLGVCSAEASQAAYELCID